MKDCVLCGAMISFFGRDICVKCAAEIADRASRKSKAYYAGVQAYKDSLNICNNPFIFGQDEFLPWVEGWLSERFVQTTKKQKGKADDNSTV